MIPLSELYAQQNGHVFQVTADEIKAYFGMTLVMEYHRLPCIRNYWSSEPDLGVNFIANVMPRRCFEEIRAYFHFNDVNETIRFAAQPCFQNKTSIINQTQFIYHWGNFILIMQSLQEGKL